MLDWTAMCLILNKDVKQIDHKDIFCVTIPCDIKFSLFLKSKLRRPVEWMQVKENLCGKSFSGFSRYFLRKKIIFYSNVEKGKVKIAQNSDGPQYW